MGTEWVVAFTLRVGRFCAWISCSRLILRFFFFFKSCVTVKWGAVWSYGLINFCITLQLKYIIFPNQRMHILTFDRIHPIYGIISCLLGQLSYILYLSMTNVQSDNILLFCMTKNQYLSQFRTFKKGEESWKETAFSVHFDYWAQ